MRHVLVMTQDKQCKHSVRYATVPTVDMAVLQGQQSSLPVETIYVSRTAFPSPMPERLTVTIDDGKEVRS